MAATHTWPDLIDALVHGENLTSADTAWAMDQVMRGLATPAQIAGFMIALRAKGETIEEVEGLVDTMYAHALTVSVEGPIVDVVGTGGDRAKTVNISTMSAIVAAGAGAKVVKHGSRAASSASGSADVLGELGVALDVPPERVGAVADEVGITFCFAQLFHPAMRHSAALRKELGVPTTFNILGPLANPARPKAQALGVADVKMAPLVAGVLARRGVSGFVFHGDDDLDELSVCTTSHVWTVLDGTVHEEVFDPRDVGIDHTDKDARTALRGAEPSYNAAVARRLLAGEEGAVRDAVLLSAAATLATLEPSPAPFADRVAAVLPRAVSAIDSGAAAAVLDRWTAVTNKYAKQP
jgi:anthranilate phosphoribosyltransferase